MKRSAFKQLISFYDLQGLCFGILLACLSMVFLKGAGLVTGQTAGLALLLSYVTPLGFSALFLLLTIPFLVMGALQRGIVFALRTTFAVVGISILVPIFIRLIEFETINPLLAAILGGVSAGMGVIAMFRHNASAGGMTVLALLVEQKTGIKAGWTQLTLDFMIFAGAATVLSVEQLIYSFIGAVVMNLMIAWNFRIDQSRGHSTSAKAN